MTDEHLSSLFAEGTAPERDAAFAQRVNAQIGGARVRLPLSLLMRAAGAFAVAGAIYLTGRALETAPIGMAETSLRFMGVPAPIVLGVLLVALAVRSGRALRLR